MTIKALNIMAKLQALALLVTLLVSATTAQDPCTLQSGTEVTLTLSEVTQADIDAFAAGTGVDPNLKMSANIPINGLLGITVQTLELRQSNPKYTDPSLFAISGPLSGFTIKAAKPIDRDGGPGTLDDKDIFIFKLHCTATDGNIREYPITINIQDENDNTPKFTGSVYTTDLNELTPVNTDAYDNKYLAGQTFYPIEATDVDQNQDNGKISYSLVDTPGVTAPNQGTAYFRLPLDTQTIIKLRNKIDYEALTNKTVYLTIVATDNAIPLKRRSSSALVEFHIKDGNDLPPAFSYPGCLKAGSPEQCVDPMYTATFTGSTGALTPKEGPVTAKDLDSLNYPVKYSIIPSSIPTGLTNNFFSINPTSGVVSVDKNISPFRSTNPEIILQIRADENNTNDNQYSTTARFKIVNSKLNVSPPTLTTSSGNNLGYIPEDAPSGTVVSEDEDLLKKLKITAKVPDDAVDADKNTLTYQIQSETPSGSFFTIDSTTGLVKNLKTFDRETNPTHTVIITATDTSSATATTTLSIIVLDANDNSPVFTETNARSVEENKPTGTSVGAPLKATDKDEGNNGLVACSVDPPDPYFSIDASSGQIKTKVPLDYEKLKQYTLQVTATDSGASPRSTKVDVLINVIDVQESIVAISVGVASAVVVIVVVILFTYFYIRMKRKARTKHTRGEGPLGTAPSDSPLDVLRTYETLTPSHEGISTPPEQPYTSLTSHYQVVEDPVSQSVSTFTGTVPTQPSPPALPDRNGQVASYIECDNLTEGAEQYSSILPSSVHGRSNTDELSTSTGAEQYSSIPTVYDNTIL